MSKKVILVISTLFALQGVGCKKQESKTSAMSSPMQKKEITDLAPIKQELIPEKKPEPISLEKRLINEIGDGTQPVAVLPSPHGLLVTSADNKRWKLLTSEKVPWVLVDHRAKVIWFGVAKQGGVWVADLLAPELKPVKVLSHTSVKGPIAVLYPKNTTNEGELLNSLNYHYGSVVEVIMDSKAIKVTRTMDILAEIFSTKGRPVYKYLDVPTADKQFLLSFAKRAEQRQLQLAPIASIPSSKKLKQIPHCGDKKLCGEGEQIPQTTLWRVLVKHSCGDMCYNFFQAYDPKEEEFFDPVSQEHSKTPFRASFLNLQDIWLARNGKAFIKDGKIYHWDGRVISVGDGKGGGWLEGQWYLE